MSNDVVTVIAPCRNEAAHIDAFLASAFAQRLPEDLRLEVVVADGASDDGTRAKLTVWQAREPRLTVIDNPTRITSAALNRAIAAANGATIVRMDVHTDYADDYVAKCKNALDETGATCVGGAWRPVGSHGRQRMIAAAFRSRFGSGGAASRRPDYTGETDTVYLGSWRRADLLRLGGFDEALVRNQDDELALRIVNSGGRVWQSASIRSWYTPRASFAALFLQFFQYGYWKVPVIRKHRLPASPRHLVPFVFVGVLALLMLAGIIWRPAWWALTSIVAVYAFAAFASAWPLAAGSLGDVPGIFWAFTCMHFGYGIGFTRALIDIALLRRDPGAAATRLTR